MIFLSLCICTIRPANIIGLLDNLEQTAADKSSFEVLICVNEGDRAVLDALEAHRNEVTFSFRAIEEPKREGYYSLHHGYEALRRIAAPGSYFLWQISDEIRIETHGWDERLKAYIGLFPDDLFRLRLSLNKWRHYHYLYECFPYPDNYTVTTRKWYDTTGGSGDIWGPDSWHQGIDWFLGQLKNHYEPYGKGVFRSIPVHDVRLANEEAGQGLGDKQYDARTRRIKQVYKRLCGLTAQENFLCIACVVNAHVWMRGYAREHAGARLAVVEQKSRVLVREEGGKVLFEQSTRIVPFLLGRKWRKIRRMLPNLGLVSYAWHRLRRN